MARSHSTDDETPQPKTEDTPAANPAGVEERLTKLEETIAKLMPRIEALTGPLL